MSVPVEKLFIVIICPLETGSLRVPGLLDFYTPVTASAGRPTQVTCNTGKPLTSKDFTDVVPVL